MMNITKTYAVEKKIRKIQHKYIKGRKYIFLSNTILLLYAYTYIYSQFYPFITLTL